MPDSSGRFRPISVPRVPWHEVKEWDDFETHCREGNAFARAVRYELDALKDLPDDLPKLQSDDPGTEALSDVQDA